MAWCRRDAELELGSGATAVGTEDGSAERVSSQIQPGSPAPVKDSSGMLIEALIVAPDGSYSTDSRAASTRSDREWSASRRVR